MDWRWGRAHLDHCVDKETSLHGTDYSAASGTIHSYYQKYANLTAFERPNQNSKPWEGWHEAKFHISESANIGGIVRTFVARATRIWVSACYIIIIIIITLVITFMQDIYNYIP